MRLKTLSGSLPLPANKVRQRSVALQEETRYCPSPLAVHSHLQQLVAHRIARAGGHKHKVKVQLFE